MFHWSEGRRVRDLVNTAHPQEPLRAAEPVSAAVNVDSYECGLCGRSFSPNTDQMWHTHMLEFHGAMHTTCVGCPDELFAGHMDEGPVTGYDDYINYKNQGRGPVRYDEEFHAGTRALDAERRRLQHEGYPTYALNEAHHIIMTWRTNS